MKYYFAPLEGITWYIYRNAHHLFFPGLDKYFAPFIVSGMGRQFSAREENDLIQAHNQNVKLIPQVLTNRVEDFLFTLNKLQNLGYDEVNLNFGCPSGTVVSKNRGAGFLADPKMVDRFLDGIFSATNCKISVKTRIGIEDPDEFNELINVYNKYPLEELIVHPRVLRDHYKNKPNLSTYFKAADRSKNSICYNGDILNCNDYENLMSQGSGTEKIMIGRGLIRNPGLVRELNGSNAITKEELYDFHNKILADYKEVLSGDTNALYRMKEIWAFMMDLFADHEKYTKKIRKAQSCQEYEVAVAALFRDLELKSNR
ncbi:MAG: tRNA-dihydrouridine synthase family protein [Lachnospiraceae bacterium]|nr:tRNA-dihydrouridine synthase family protein [Lachnospiraceae bacterium]MDD3660740.1 tRNA-dihydrouridine synthase family protein [Lachnospiraceae bacterium]